jgi:Ni,Fe-hydrogenase III small subunit
MFDLLKSRFHHGYQAVKDIPGTKVNPKYRGFPVVDESLAGNEMLSVIEQCPSHAIVSSPLRVDLGRCVFCGECAHKTKAVSFSNFHHTASMSRDHLVIREGMTPEKYEREAFKACRGIHAYFGRSLKLRSVSAGGCNACEWELNAGSNVNFDMGRYGIDMVASPRHADGLVITGPVSENMAAALEDTYSAIPSPKIVIAMGSCAISGGVFDGSSAINREFFEKVKVDLFIPGCPPHPLSVINGILGLIGRKG